MGRPAAPEKDFSLLQVSHQEMARIIDTLDEVYDSMRQAGAEWLPVQATGSMVSEELGYEDVDEFEDAISGTWSDFLDVLPHVEKRVDSTVTGGVTFKLKPEPPKEEWQPTKMTVTISDSKQLMNSALLKSPYAAVKVPHIEFEIQPDGKKQFNTLYNHLSSALFNLGQHVEMMQEGESKDLILDTCEQISQLLDVQEPYTIVIEDRSGTSSLQPLDNVVVEDMTPEDIANARQVEPAQAAPAFAMQAPGAGASGMDDVDDVDD